MTYNETILDGMMKFPTIYPNEYSVLNHILSYSSATVDKNGEVSFDECSSREAISRTRDSVLATNNGRNPDETTKILKEFDDRERVCFHSCGSNNFTNFTAPYKGGDSLLIQLIKNPNMKLAKDWQYGVSRFIEDAHRYSQKEIRIIATGKALASRMGLDYQKSQIERNVSEWKDLVTMTAHLVSKPAVKVKPSKNSPMNMVRQEVVNGRDILFVAIGSKKVSPSTAKEIGTIIGGRRNIISSDEYFFQ
jgi:hypothetical protein